jgi:lipase chaperone LimK
MTPGETRFRRRDVGVLLLALGIVAASATWFLAAPGCVHFLCAAQHASSRPTEIAATTGLAAAAPLAQALPASLAGSSVPRLPLGEGGHLLKSHAVREFFDYLMTTQGEISSAALDTLVRRQIAAQLDGLPAQAEALDVWRRYRAYQDGLAHLSTVPASPNGKPDFDVLQLELDQRAALASRAMGDWNAAFFGNEVQKQQIDLESLRIAADPSLSDAQKRARIAALEQQLPLEERATRERARRQRETIETVAALQKSGASPEALRAQITQTLGPQAAERAAQMQQDENAWQAKYAQYAAQRAQVDAQGLSPADREASIARLRAQFFTNPGEVVRAASWDRSPGS